MEMVCTYGSAINLSVSLTIRFGSAMVIRLIAVGVYCERKLDKQVGEIVVRKMFCR